MDPYGSSNKNETRQSLRIHLTDLLGRVIISKIIALGQELSKNASN